MDLGRWRRRNEPELALKSETRLIVGKWCLPWGIGQPAAGNRNSNEALLAVATEHAGASGVADQNVRNVLTS